MKRELLFAALLVCSFFASAGTSSKIVVVPKGMFVRSDNPPCGVDSGLSQLGKDPKTTKAVAKLFGPKATAVVVLVSKADEVAMQSGGDLAGLWNKAVGRKDGASCATVCLRLPAGAKPRSLVLSSRTGAGGLKPKFQDGSILENASLQDYSGWRSVVSAREGGRWLVCGTATNWSNDQEATKRIAVIH